MMRSKKDDTVRSDCLTLILEVFFRLILGGVFIYSAVVKISNPTQFALAVAGYRFLPDQLVGLFSLTLPMVELVSGIGLVFSKWSRESAAVICGLLGMFLIGLTQAMIRGLNISCGCFGSDSPGGDSLEAALVRDLALWGPACWLAFRPRRWLFNARPWWAHGTAVLLAVLAAVLFVVLTRPPTPGERREALEREIMTMGTNAVPAEVWTTDFPSAIVQARRTHRPLLVYVGNVNCPFCQHMKEALAGQAFATWVKGSGIYLARGRFNETNQVATQRVMVEYIRYFSNHKVKAYPYVAYYWQKENGEEVTGLFTGRRQFMPGESHRTLIGEFINAGNSVLKDFWNKTGTRLTVDELVELDSKRLFVAMDDGGRGGTCSMYPKDGVLKVEKFARLFAHPAPDMRLVGWKGPDGKMLPNVKTTTLTVRSGMPGGTYTAVCEPKPAKSVRRQRKKGEDKK